MAAPTRTVKEARDAPPICSVRIAEGVMIALSSESIHKMAAVNEARNGKEGPRCASMLCAHGSVVQIEPSNPQSNSQVWGSNIADYDRNNRSELAADQVSKSDAICPHRRPLIIMVAGRAMSLTSH